jgi:hypothetical protein
MLPLLGCLVISFTNPISKSANFGTITKPIALKEDSLFAALQLNTMGLSKQAFQYALKGYHQLINAGKIKKNEVLSIIDFSLPSTAKRLFVINVSEMKLLYNTYVSHGKNSGKAVAASFSNKTNSNKSSLGFYITQNTYSGKHGISLKLEGEEKGINDNAYSRGIVIHGADYVNENYIQQQGYIGRSQGCPAIPVELHEEIIEVIKEGSCLFIYGTSKYYLNHSQLLKQQKNIS